MTTVSAPLGAGPTGADLSGAPRDDVLVEDEEIASVEADGQGGAGETRALTAALVTSAVEYAGTSSTPRTSNAQEAATRRRSPRTRRTGAAAPASKASRPAARSLSFKAKPGRKSAPQPAAPQVQGPSSAVPNPLAGMHPQQQPQQQPQPQPQTQTQTQTQIAVAHTAYPSATTGALMSAVPAAVAASAPPGAAPAAKTVKFGGEIADIAESMSGALPPQHRQDVVPPGGQPPQQQGRGRIFSIDLDPAVLDFVENVVDDRGGPADGGRGPLHRRDRGFSFEFFQFAAGEEDAAPPPILPVPAPSAVVAPPAGPPPAGLPPPPVAAPVGVGVAGRPRGDSVVVDPTTGVVAGTGGRPRGDSIIFDPASFREGGIHEASALRQVAAPPSAVVVPPPGRAAPSSSSTAAAAARPQPRPRPAGSAPRSAAGAPPRAFSDGTIHMPHGSDAAAAAAAGRPPPGGGAGGGGSGPDASSKRRDHPPSPTHAACPMDLLNRDGRIGIYLPEERRARIAKFHSKRKMRVWRKRIKYDCRKKLAESRPRVKGRFVKRSDVEDGG